jgi:hypothetical protein
VKLWLSDSETCGIGALGAGKKLQWDAAPMKAAKIELGEQHRAPMKAPQTRARVEACSKNEEVRLGVRAGLSGF